MTTTTTILIFGQLTDVFGGPKLEMPVSKDTEGLKQILFDQYPSLRDMKFVVSVDRKIIHQNTIIPPGVEVALLPPFSGG